VNIISGRYAGCVGAVVRNVLEKTVDYPDDLAKGFGIEMYSGGWVLFRCDQVDFLK